MKQMGGYRDWRDVVYEDTVREMTAQVIAAKGAGLSDGMVERAWREARRRGGIESYAGTVDHMAKRGR